MAGVCKFYALLGCLVCWGLLCLCFVAAFVLTHHSRRSLRSLGRAKARPLIQTLGHKMKYQHIVLFSVIFCGVLLLSGCTCGGLRLSGGTKCDNLFTPNWENRQAKFAGSLNRNVGRIFPTQGMCDSNYKAADTQSDGSIRYYYSYGQGCTYYCAVKEALVISTSYKGGEGEQSCWLSLN